MYRTLVISGLVAAAFATTSTAQTSTQAQATMKVVDRTPLTLGGTGFDASERVRLVVKVAARRQTNLIATREGSFRVAFRGVAYNRCSGLNAFAFGSRGSRAQLILPARACPPLP